MLMPSMEPKFFLPKKSPIMAVRSGTRPPKPAPHRTANTMAIGRESVSASMAMASACMNIHTNRTATLEVRSARYPATKPLKKATMV